MGGLMEYISQKVVICSIWTVCPCLKFNLSACTLYLNCMVSEVAILFCIYVYSRNICFI